MAVSWLLVTLGPAVSGADAGGEAWLARYGRPKSEDRGVAIAVSPDGSRVFVGGTRCIPRQEYCQPTRSTGLVAYEADSGDTVWVAHVGGSTESLAVGADGRRLYRVGSTCSRGPSEFCWGDYAVTAIDGDSGAVAWTTTYDGKGKDWDDSPTGLALSPDGSRLFVTGRSCAAAGADFCPRYDFATVAYDAATGARLWVARYDGPAGGDDGAGSIAVEGTRVIVTGYSAGAGGSGDFATVAYDAATGARLWVARYDGPAGGDDSAVGVVAVPAEGLVIVSGSSCGHAGQYCTAGDFATVAYDVNTGDERWVARFDGPGSVDDVARAIAVSPSGSAVFVTGWSCGSIGESCPRYDFATVAYDSASGRRLWVARYDGPAAGNDYAEAVTVSPDGALVVVVGASCSIRRAECVKWRQGPFARKYDYATVVYEASTGAQRWATRYQGPFGNDEGKNVVVSPDSGRIYVLGTSETLAANPAVLGLYTDYVTVAYEL